MHDVLVIGAGSIGERHIRCFMTTKRARISFVEINPELRETIAGRYPEAAAKGSLEEAIDRDIDSAVIATPAPLHVPQALQLIDRGVHVLIEKPLSVNMGGVEELTNGVARRRVVAAVAYVLRAHPALAAMREAVNSRRFGRPLELVVVSGSNFPSFRPAYRNTYYARRESGGGAVQDALTHLLNTGQWLVGDIDRVMADIAHMALEGVDVEDTAHVLARHGDVLASYSLNQYQAPSETTITVVCERGTARVELHTGRWRSAERPGEPWVEHGGEPLDRDIPFIRQAHAFLDAVDGKSPPLCTLDDGVATLRANIAVLRSAAETGWCSTSSGMRIPS